MSVTAAAGGTVTIYGANGYARCWISIQHADGWQTRYYHLRDIPAGLSNGQAVSAGQVIGAMGYPGVDTCGTGTFRHVHFSLYRNGVEQAIDGTSIGGYTVHQSGSSYCGYWTKNSTGAIVADARTACMAVPSLTNNQVLPGSGIGEGTFVRASDNGEVYRIAGGAPIYVSTWSIFGGSQPTVDVSRSQLNAMRQYPADGTFVTGAPSGRVYRFAGGSPHYVSTWNSFGGAKPTIAVDDFTLTRPDGASPLNHVRRYPVNGTFITNASNGRVYRVAGGAPLYVSSWANLGGQQPTTTLDPWDFANYANLRAVPADMFLRGRPSNRIYRVVRGGHPYYVPSWSPYGGTQPYLDVDDWAIDNCDHLDCGPFGALDTSAGGGGTVTVTGWSVDPNAVGSSTRVHVYVGGPAGSSTAQGIDAGVANLTRNDVEKVFPATGTNHGFSLTVATTKRGAQPVYVYGINVPGSKGQNNLLGQGTATIKETPIRVSGSNRYATSAAISAATFPAGVPVAYVATGANFPDALSGGPAGGVKGGPVLLVTASSIPSEVATELKRLKPARIVILGGTGAVSNTVKAALGGYTSGAVDRVSGSNRYATSAAISAATFPAGVPVAYVATGANFPDALSGGPAGGVKGGPVLLVTATSIPSEVATELKRLKPARIVILGGTGAVSNTVKAALGGYTSGAVDRVSGSNRYATSAAISAATFPAGAPVAYVATGANFPDALSGGPAGGVKGGPVLLVTATSIPSEVATELKRLKPARIVILGGTGAVSNTVKAALGSYIT